MNEYKNYTDDQLENASRFGDKQAKSELFKRDMKARVKREREVKDRMNSGQMLNSDKRKMWRC